MGAVGCPTDTLASLWQAQSGPSSGPGPLLVSRDFPELPTQALPRAEVQSCPWHSQCPLTCPRATALHPMQGDNPRPSPSPCVMEAYVLFLCAVRCWKQETSFSFYLLQLISSFLLHPANLTLTVSCLPASLTFEIWSLLWKLCLALRVNCRLPIGPCACTHMRVCECVCVLGLEKLGWGGWGTAEIG